jgi:NhaP-type Na+/H+ or K+/H+ antiporter
MMNEPKTKLQMTTLSIGIALTTIGAALIGAFHNKGLATLMLIVLLQMVGAVLLGISIGIGLKRTNKRITFSSEDEAISNEPEE